MTARPSSSMMVLAQLSIGILLLGCVPNNLYQGDVDTGDTSVGTAEADEGICGNGIVEADEECDEGDMNGAATCNYQCALVTCGDGVATPGEICYVALQDLNVGPGARNLEYGFVNADGYGDLLVPNYDGDSVSILLGGEHCEFVEASVVDIPLGGVSTLGPYQAVIGDFNNDNKSDFATANRDDISIAVLLGNGDGTFQAPYKDYAAFGLPESTAVGYLDEDDALDLAIGLGNAVVASVYYGDGAGGFTKVDIDAQDDAAIVEIDELTGDQLDDLMVANRGAGTVSIYPGRAGGIDTVPDVSVDLDSDPSSLAAADIDDDGDTDIIVTGSPNVLYVLRKGAGLTFDKSSVATGSDPRSVRVLEANADGELDLAVVNAADNTLRLHVGVGDGAFSGYVAYDTGPTPVFLEIGDCNDDGVMDLFVTNEGTDTVTVYRSNP